MRGSEPVPASGTGGTVAEVARPGLEFDCDPTALSRSELVLERDGLTEAVPGWLR
jgi:hypothetical protein